MEGSNGPASLKRFFERTGRRSLGGISGYYIDQGKRAYRFVSEHDRAGARPHARPFSALANMRKAYFRPDALPVHPFFNRLITEW